MKTSVISERKTLRLVQLGLFGEDETFEVTAKRLYAPRAKAVPVNVSYLDLPLFAVSDLRNTAIITDEEALSHENEAQAIASFIEPIEEEEMEIQWGVDAIVQLHSCLLEESLKALAGRGNARQKLEILEWIFEAENENIARQRDVPFSFELCCRLEGMDDNFIRKFIDKRLNFLLTGKVAKSVSRPEKCPAKAGNPRMEFRSRIQKPRKAARCAV